MPAPTTLGEALAQGFAGFTNNYLGTQNTLEQQRQAAADKKRALDQQQQQLDADAAYKTWTMQRTDHQDQLDGRETLFKSLIAPSYGSFKEGLQADAAQYAPTIKDPKTGLMVRNPGANQALYEARQRQIKDAEGRYFKVTSSVISGEGFDGYSHDLMDYLGLGGHPGMPARPEADPAASPAPAASGTEAAPSPTPPSSFGATYSGGASPNFGAAAPQGAGATPDFSAAYTAPPAQDSAGAAPPTGPTSLPDSITAIKPSDLLNMDDATIQAHYGDFGLRYASAARAEYQQQQAATATAMATARVKSWESQVGELSKRTDLTGDQRIAIQTITGLMQKPTLSEDEQGLLTDAFGKLTPRLYTADSWQKVLDTKDPATILAQLPVYQQYAPQLVAGFDPSGLHQALDDGHAASAAKTALDQATAGSTTATGAATSQASGIKAALGGAESIGAVIDKGDGATLRALAQNPEGLKLFPGYTPQFLTGMADQLDAARAAGTRKDNAAAGADEAGAGKSLVDTGAAAWKLATDKLAGLASDPRDPYEILRATPGLLNELAAQGLNPTEAVNLLAQGQAKYQQGWDKDHIANLLGQAQVRSGNATAAATETSTLFQQVLGGSKSLADVISAKDTATLRALAASPAALRTLGLKDGSTLTKKADAIDAQTQADLNKTNADTGSLKAGTALTTAQTTTEDQLRPGKVKQQGATLSLTNAQAGEAGARTGLIGAQTTESGARAGLITAQTGEAGARTGLITAQAGDIPAAAADRADRTAAYVSSVKGRSAVDGALVSKYNADTALTRAKNPNDPLYNPAVFQSTTKGGKSPFQQAADAGKVWYSQMESSRKAAASTQNAINQRMQLLQKQATGASGTVSQAKLQTLMAGDPEYQKLITQRDGYLKDMAGYKTKGDDAVTGVLGSTAPVQPPDAKVPLGLPSAQQWAKDHPQVDGVPSDCAAIAGMYLNSLGYTIKPDNSAAGLERNAVAGGWTKQPINAIQQGDLIVWTTHPGHPYGLNSGKHNGVVAGFDAKGNPLVLVNPGLQKDGSQGITKITPMFDPAGAVAYRSPKASAARPALTPGAPKPGAATVTPGKPLPAPPAKPKPAPSTAQTPDLPAPKGRFTGGMQNALISNGMWANSARVGTAAEAKDWLDRATLALLPAPKFGKAQRDALGRDLAATLGW